MIAPRSEPIAVYCVADVAPDVVERLLAVGEWQWAYVERETGTELLWLADLLVQGWQLWRYGRLFSPASELTWWWRSANRRSDDRGQLDGRYQLRLLTTTTPPLVEGLAWGAADESWQPWGEPATTRLHGELDSERSQETSVVTWSEARIPRWLAYPLATTPDDAPNRVALLTQAYAQNGVVGLTRLLAVMGVSTV